MYYFIFYMYIFIYIYFYIEIYKIGTANACSALSWTRFYWQNTTQYTFSLQLMTRKMLTRFLIEIKMFMFNWFIRSRHFHLHFRFRHHHHFRHRRHSLCCILRELILWSHFEHLASVSTCTWSLISFEAMAKSWLHVYKCRVILVVHILQNSEFSKYSREKFQE